MKKTLDGRSLKGRGVCADGIKYSTCGRYLYGSLKIANLANLSKLTRVTFDANNTWAIIINLNNRSKLNWGMAFGLYYFLLGVMV